MLSAIDLDDVQEGAYRALVSMGAAKAGDLSHRLGMAEDETARLQLGRRAYERGWVAREPS